MTDFLILTGAVEASGADAGVAAHYGNPLAEQRALASGHAVVDLSHRAVITVTGEDRLTWLNSMTSQAMANLAPGKSVEALLLNQTGRIDHALKAVDDGATTWLIVERQEASALVSWLESMRFMMRVEVADRTSEYAALGMLAGAAGAQIDGVRAADPNGVPLVWIDPWSEVATGGHQYAAESGHPASSWTWREVLVERARLADLTRLPVAGTLAAEALRIAAWRPRFATEVDEKTIPHELDWLRSAVHLSKGCYRGQETVAKVHNLGHPPRRLVMLHLDGSDAVLPIAGDDVKLGDAVVGTVTSSAMHYELGPIALAVVKRNTPEDAVLAVLSDGVSVSAAQEVIVPSAAGASLGNVRKQFTGGGGPGRRA